MSAFLTQLQGAAAQLVTLVNTLVPFMIGIAVLFFIWGVIQYVLKAGDPEARANARGFMIYAIIGLFVIVAAWGLVNLLKNITGATTNTITVPTVPTS